ncbi:M15 family metallopeptidase [Methylobacterium sp. J-030]|uniref:M15 family metallopeptidase n=1 Tax=Methylobacterium sp. J-030 TaxID=2836627 RepID=UPI001FB8A523|nr:M15 family metallopeptidase [Methylobacterium sp. J-030]MCJ2068149.1 M15 family metallopeptidase [Methylobacterium sp. J-030]
MATMIDALYVGLGLDPSAFIKGQKQTMASLAKTRESAVKEGKEIERSLDSAGEAVERLARNALKLLAIFTGGRAIGQFVTDIGHADAAMGRMADRLGVAPGRIAAFDNAVKRIGGSAGEGAASFQRLSDTINELRTSGNSSALPAFAKLQGISRQQIRLNGTLEESFGDLAEAAKGTAEKVGASQASYLLRQAGYSEATINLLLKGRAAVEKALTRSQRQGLVSKADADAAQHLGEQYEDLSDRITDFARKISTALTPVLTDLMRRFGDWLDQNKEWLRTEIVAKVEEFAQALRSIDWEGIGKGVLAFARGADDAAKSIGGWKIAAEAFFGLWAASKIATLFTPLFAQLALVRLTLLRMGPIGWGLLGLGAVAGALASADPSKNIVSGGVPGGSMNPGDELPGVNSSENRPARGGIFARARHAVVSRLQRGRGGTKLPGNVGIGGWWTAERQQHAIDTLVKGGVSELGARALVARWSAVEAPGGPTSVNPRSGAYGIGQWLTADRRVPIQGNPDFDAQLQHALKELHGPEGRALAALNAAKTPMEAARGASIYERAEGWNAAAGTDNFTGRTAAAMDKLVGGGASARTAASATGNPDGSPLPTDGTGVNNDLMRVVKRAQEISAVRFHIHEGLRTLERQKEMVARGWSKTFSSKHLTGRAVDLRADGDPAVGDLDSAKYAKINDAMKKAASELGVPVQWGGDSFGKFKDVPHFQLPDGYKSNAGAYGADPAKTSALQARQAGAMAAVAQAQAAQSAMVANTTNDNRSSRTSSAETHFHGDFNIQTAATDGPGLMSDLKRSLRGRAGAMVSNTGQA